MTKGSASVACAFWGVMSACGSSSAPAAGGGTASSTGSVGGHAFAPRDASAVRVTQRMTLPQNPNTTVTTTTLALQIADVSGVCADYQRATAPGAVSVLTLAVDPGGLVPAAATYVVNGNGTNPMVGSAYFSVTDGSCKSVFGAAATSGTITISSATDASITGSFDLGDFMTPMGAAGGASSTDRLTGTFVAPTCDVTVGGDGGVTCGM